MARARSRPSANVLVISASAVGEAMAPPMPCTARAMSSQAADGANPPSRDARGEQADAGHEDPTPAEDVAGAATEQKQATEGQRVRVEHPGQAGGGKVQAVLDVRQGDVDHRCVQHDHQLAGDDDGQRKRLERWLGPGAIVVGWWAPQGQRSRTRQLLRVHTDADRDDHMCRGVGRTRIGTLTPHSNDTESTFRLSTEIGVRIPAMAETKISRRVTNLRRAGDSPCGERAARRRPAQPRQGARRRREGARRTGPDRSHRRDRPPAGVGVGTVYRHFPTKRELHEAIVQAHFDQLIEIVEESLNSPDPGEAFFEYIDATVRASAHKAVARTISESDPEVRRRREEWMSALIQRSAELLRRSQDAGAIRKDVTYEDVRVMLGGLCMAYDRLALDPIQRDRSIALLRDSADRYEDPDRLAHPAARRPYRFPAGDQYAGHHVPGVVPRARPSRPGVNGDPQQAANCGRRQPRQAALPESL